jgi:hypothetical protein
VHAGQRLAGLLRDRPRLGDDPGELAAFGCHQWETISPRSWSGKAFGTQNCAAMVQQSDMERITVEP